MMINKISCVLFGNLNTIWVSQIYKNRRRMDKIASHHGHNVGPPNVPEIGFKGPIPLLDLLSYMDQNVELLRERMKENCLQLRCD